MPFCPKCGTQNQDDANACMSCGNSLKQTLNLDLTQNSGEGFFDKIKRYISSIISFFDSGEFFKISWKGLFYYLQALIYAGLPVAAIVMAIKMSIFDMPAKVVIIGFIAFIFLCVASFLSVIVILNRTESFDKVTKDFAVSKVTLSNFYDFFKTAFVHTIETNVYASGFFAAVVIFGLSFCSLFVEEIRQVSDWYILLGFIIGPIYAYANIFITKVIVLFLNVFLEYLPKLIIIPVKALYNLFGIVIDTRHNLWK